MSYILEALRKADQERSIGDVPDLETPHWNRRRGTRIRWVWVAVGLLIVNGALLAFLFNRDDGSESKSRVSGFVSPPIESKPVTSGFVPVPPAVLQPARVATPEQTERAPQTLTARPERKVISEPRQPGHAVVEPVPENKVTVVEPPAPAIVDAGRAAPEAVTRMPVEQPRKPVQTPAPEIPEWGELSLEFRSGFNPPRLDVHVYDDEPSRRFILVDLRKFREGDMLDNGARLEKIQPGSIQLYYQGTRFRYDK